MATNLPHRFLSSTLKIGDLLPSSLSRFGKFSRTSERKLHHLSIATTTINSLKYNRRGIPNKPINIINPSIISSNRTCNITSFSSLTSSNITKQNIIIKNKNLITTPSIIKRTMSDTKYDKSGKHEGTHFEEGHKPDPKQNQDAPGHEHKMDPEPVYSKLPDGKGGYEEYKAAGKLTGKKALITGGDSGIGRATAVLFAMEGADVAIVYLKEEEKDAQETKHQIENVRGQEGKRKCYTLPADLTDKEECERVVKEAVEKLGGLDVLVNNCGYQNPADTIEELSEENWDKTFKTNIYSYFRVTKHSMPHLRKSPTASIINVTSVTQYKGRPDLLDYSSTKGAIVAFTRALSNQVAGDGVRVNAVAPGPIWTPLVVWSFTEEQRDKFGQNKPLGRPGQPSEVATCCVFLASTDSSYMSGQTLHPNGGDVVNG